MHKSNILNTLISKYNTIKSFTRNQVSALLNKTMKDIKNIGRLAKEDEKKIKQYRGENKHLNQSLKILHKNFENLRKLAKLHLNDKLTRKVVKRELKEEIKSATQIKRKKRSLKSSFLESSESSEEEEQRELEPTRKTNQKKEENSIMPRKKE